MVSSPRNGVIVDSDAIELDSSSWCFAAINTPRGPASTLLVDSGADDLTFAILILQKKKLH